MCVLSVREKKGQDDLITELSRIIFNKESDGTTKKSINAVIAWLYRSDIIGYCDKAVECNPGDTRPNMRDLGVARYFLKTGGIKENAASGYLSENFVYIELLKRKRNMELSGISPMFGTYKTGEIDFLVGNIINDKTYGIEVKVDKAIGKTGQMLLDDGKVEAVYFLKGDTYGGITDRKITVPIYLVGRVRFDYEREM